MGHIYQFNNEDGESEGLIMTSLDEDSVYNFLQEYRDTLDSDSDFEIESFVKFIQIKGYVADRWFLTEFLTFHP